KGVRPRRRDELKPLTPRTRLARRSAGRVFLSGRRRRITEATSRQARALGYVRRLALGRGKERHKRLRFRRSGEASCISWCAGKAGRQEVDGRREHRAELSLLPHPSRRRG